VFLYNGDNTETNVVALPNDLLYTEYVSGVPAPGLEWAYCNISAYKAQTYNSKAVAFFGSSHMNNESNYIYRKMIANFGTSNVEHQARI
jgi:anaerobic selenocysteine-containing dehydrogenase